MTRIVLTGSRNWADPTIVDEVLAWFDSALVAVGDCPTGLDAMVCAKVSAERLEVFYADWERYGRRAGPIRNSCMLSKATDLVVGFWLPGCKGTVDCCEQAVAAGMATVFYDGIAKCFRPGAPSRSHPCP